MTPQEEANKSAQERNKLVDQVNEYLDMLIRNRVRYSIRDLWTQIEVTREEISWGGKRYWTRIFNLND